ncbi:phage tail assembly chaperone [Pseudomonas sp. ACM7]|uniref:phage tail assembly chaperone n=1 Tax=Pseudomonas sp. ACM7 TaxID=2052956 RepID=UPI001011BC61|nr:phage tail assembly chaperone [Pseudomonas sp. ACM7]QAY92569.1 phage tail protein [Pseudomonas sp. ACM7]
MKIYWSSETGGFYDSRINSALPAGSIEITSEYRELLIKGMQEKRVVVATADGYPVLQAPPPPTAEQVAMVERAWRDEALDGIKWLRDRHRDEQDMGLPTTLGVTQFSELLSYMQALRSWPQSPEFPNVEGRPVPQQWIVDQAS